MAAVMVEPLTTIADSCLVTKRSGPTVASPAVLYQDQVRAHVRRRVRSAVDAEDIAQETWVRAATAAGDSAIGNVRAYLLRIASNLAIDHIRHRSLRCRVVTTRVDDPEAVQIASSEPSAEQVLIDRQRQVAFETILAELPERCRQALILSRIEGWPHTRIAAHLGVSINTVTSDIRKALSLCLARSSQLDV